MDLAGERNIAATRDAVWSALNDPMILKNSIPGCEELEAPPDGGFTAFVGVKVGPISARFTGRVTLSNLNPPISYTIEGEGAGGVAGFAKGGADVSLADVGQETLLAYTVRADVGGKIAQLGRGSSMRPQRIWLVNSSTDSPNRLQRPCLADDY
jgi:carbon monoxide dehydrogenase subunit G